jgi:hypothetical protein
VFEAHNVGVVERGHDVQFSVLESSVLQHFLDSHGLARVDHTRLVHHTEAAVANHTLGGVGQTLLRAARRSGTGRLARLRSLKEKKKEKKSQGNEHRVGN